LPDLSIADGTSFDTPTSTPGGLGYVDINQDAASENEADFLAKAKRRFVIYSTAWARIREQSRLDREFWAGKQWDVGIMNDRILAGRPCLTVNQMPRFTKQVTNEIRQNRPSIQVNPVDDSTVDDADLMEGMVRHIQVDSEADAAYDTASQHQTTFGFGYIRAVTERVNRSFNQKIKIKREQDPFKHYPDPNCKELDFSDARGWFVFEDIPAEEYRILYHNTQMASLSNMTSVGDTMWYPNQHIRIAEYFWVDETDREWVKWADGSEHWADESPKEQIDESVDRVTDKIKTVHWVKFNAVEIMAGANELNKKTGKRGYKVIPGDFIPIVPVLGDEYITDEGLHYSGMVRFAHDAQRQYNYMRTAVVEAIALAPKAPYVMAEGQDENHEDEWKQANTRNLSALKYKPLALGNQLVPAPQRNQAEPPIQAMSVAVAQAQQDLMATMLISQPGLGEVGPEQSGKAIIARQQKSDVANFNYSDNQSRAMRQLGRVIVGWIPHYYDVPRMADIVNPAGEHSTVPVNQRYLKLPGGGMRVLQSGEQPPPNAKVMFHNLPKFKGSVTISTGPSYQTKRMENVASTMALIQAYPQIMQVAGDLLVGWLDFSGAREIAQRLKAMLPPALQAEEDQLSPGHVAQLQQQFQQLQAAFGKVQGILQTKQIEADTKKYVAEISALAGIREAEIKAKTTADAGSSDAGYLEQILDWKQDAAMQQQKDQAALQLQREQNSHEAAMAAAAAGHSAAMQTDQQQHAAGMQSDQNAADAAAVPPAPPAQQ
jgi:hypothetical protein